MACQVSEASGKVKGRSTFMTLPLFVSPANKGLVGVLTFVFAGGLYFLSNHYPILEPRLLSMTALDRAIPFLPWTVWVYVSEYVYFIVIYLLCREPINMNRYVSAVLAIQVLSVLIFTLWPTTYPRDLFPLPANLDPTTTWLFSTLRAGDAPTNCCPSLHVSSVFLCGFLFLNEQRRRLWFFMLWATLIGASTLTTKQHYVIDVVTGLLMAILFHWIFYRKTDYRPAREILSLRNVRLFLSRIHKNL